MDEQKVINDWFKKRYKSNNVYIKFVGYRELGSFTVGRADMGHASNSTIKLAEKLVRHQFWGKCVLWHEFNHGCTYYKLGKMGHDLDFYKLYLRKPYYWLANILLAFIYPFLR